MGMTPISPQAQWSSQFIFGFQPLSFQAGGEPFRGSATTAGTAEVPGLALQVAGHQWASTV